MTFRIRQELDLQTSIHDAHLDPLPGFDRETIRMQISTPASPTEVIEIDLHSGKSRQLKISVPPNG